MARARREVMIRTVMKDLEKEWKPSAKEVKDEYENNKEKYQTTGKVTAAHIMVMSEKKPRTFSASWTRAMISPSLPKNTPMRPSARVAGASPK